MPNSDKPTDASQQTTTSERKTPSSVVDSCSDKDTASIMKPLTIDIEAIQEYMNTRDNPTIVPPANSETTPTIGSPNDSGEKTPTNVLHQKQSSSSKS